METTKHSAELGLTRVHIANVSIQDHTERLTWIRNRDLSVSLLITETVVGDKFTRPRVVADFTQDETEDHVKAMCRDYVARQNNRQIGPLVIRPMVVDDMRPPSLEPRFDKNGRGYFGTPR